MTNRGNFNTLFVVVLLCIISIQPSLACIGCCCGVCNKPKTGVPLPPPPPPSFGYAVPPAPAPFPAYAAPPPPPLQQPLPYGGIRPVPQPVYVKRPVAAASYGVQQYEPAH